MKTIFYSFAILCLWNTASANNVVVSNVSTTGANTVSDFTSVKFNLSWDNSWRTSTGPANWDAAWVFVKFRVGVSNLVLTGASSSGTTVTVSNTASLRVGMPVVVSSGTGTLDTNTVISSISSATTFVVSASPTTALSNATITCHRIWEHASLSTSVGNHTAPAGCTINVPSDGTGVFIYRSANGMGTFSLTDVQLRWVYGTNGVPDDAPLQVQVFAIEMVYVPQGAFYVGSGGEDQAGFTNGSWTSGVTIPYQITSEAALGIDNVAGKLWGRIEGTGNGGIGNVAADAEATLAATYPKGTAAFYCMKYELSQGQYHDFLNTLTRTQQNNRTGTDLSIGVTSVTNRYAMSNSSTLLFRNGIRCDATIDANNPINFYCDNDGDGTPNETTDGEWIACNYLSWQDGAAYLDWAGLRPMTELEFEKACRGSQTPVAVEYAWGNATNFSANNITNGGQAGEVTNTANANSASANQANVQGPMRVGAFAGAATTRAQAGATYYGIMEMSGNLWDRAVTLGNAAGRSYTGVHGDGNLFRDGSANVDFWPGINGNSTTTNANTAFNGSTGVTAGAGAGTRGGSWSAAGGTPFQHLLKVSGRNNALIQATDRDGRNGWRGVRVAP